MVWFYKSLIRDVHYATTISLQAVYVSAKTWQYSFKDNHHPNWSNCYQWNDETSLLIFLKEKKKCSKASTSLLALRKYTQNGLRRASEWQCPHQFRNLHNFYSWTSLLQSLQLSLLTKLSVHVLYDWNNVLKVNQRTGDHNSGGAEACLPLKIYLRPRRHAEMLEDHLSPFPSFVCPSSCLTSYLS